MGAATEVPPNPLQVLGAPAQEVPPLTGVGKADGGEVSPDAVGGEKRDVRDVAHAVGRIAEDARLPGGLRIPGARAVHLAISSLVGVPSAGGAGAGAAAAGTGAEVSRCSRSR